MAEKRYAIAYNDDTQSWEPVVVNARVINTANHKPQNLKPEVKVEDAPRSPYPSLANNVLIVEDKQVFGRIEAGGEAKISLRLNDADPKLPEILKLHSRFGIQVTLYPDLGEAEPKAGEKPPEVIGITEVYVQRPQKWTLRFTKTLWDSTKEIDLRKVEGVPPAGLQELGDQGGRLIVQPKGVLILGGGKEKITSNQVIAKAGRCTLDHGEGAPLAGTWDEGVQGYVFQIAPAQADTPSPGQQELTVPVEIETIEGYRNGLIKLVQAAQGIDRRLEANVTDLARRFVQAFLDTLARESEETLVERRNDLTQWLLNISQILFFLDKAAELFTKALSLFEQAFERFVNNMINFAVELVFLLFDWIADAVKSARGTAKSAVKQNSKEMVEQLAEETAAKLKGELDKVKSALDAAKLEHEMASNSLENLKLPTAGPVHEEYNKLIKSQLAASANIAEHSKKLVELEANLAVAQFIKENSGRFTEKDFMARLKRMVQGMPRRPEIADAVRMVQTIRDTNLRVINHWGETLNQAIKDLPVDAPDETRKAMNRMLSYLAELKYTTQVDVLDTFNKEMAEDLIGKSPLGDRLKKISDEAKKAKEAAEQLRYRRVPYKYYEGWLAPLWYSIDVAIEWAVWLHDLAREWIPGLATAEDMIVYAIDLVLGYMMQMLSSMIDYMNSNLWIRSSVEAGLRSQAQGRAQGHGLTPKFFTFPNTPAALVEQLKPANVVKQGSSGSQQEMNAAKQKLLTRAKGGYEGEKQVQNGEVRRLFTQLCQSALDADCLQKPAPEPVVASSTGALLRRMVEPMVQYERAFAASSAMGTDYVTSVPARFQENATFQDWDGAIEWITWAVSWALKLGALLSVATGVGVAWAPALFVSADAVERVAGVIRPAVSWLGTMPDVVGFQFDVVLVACLVHKAALEGGVDLEAILVEGYYVE
ncbi:MAG TPA: hypothetical protein VJ123_03580 [Anaerolineales bacterium]|nr:hypothetical protein [Anaerolineales bacterium]